MDYKRNSAVDRSSKIFRESGNYMSSRTHFNEHVYFFKNKSINPPSADVILISDDVREVLLARFCHDCPYKDENKACTSVFLESLSKDSDNFIVFRNQKCSELLDELLRTDFLRVGVPA